MAKMADLYLVGTGIYGLSQVTIETRDIIKRCRRVLDLTHQQKLMKKLNASAVDLDPLYWTGEQREIVYARLVEMVLKEVSAGPGVALVTYGHPLFFDDVNMELLQRSRRLGYDCVVLPAVSCLDTLSIDLEIDYGDGLQLYEATDLVENRHRLNPRIHTLILQIGEFGYDVTGDSISHYTGRFKPLEKYLGKFYPDDHRIVIAFSDDGEAQELLKSRLHKLDTHRRRIFPGTTLYLPPL